jgi:hypothetical protein
MTDALLCEFDMIEWWDVARRLDPELTWDQYEADWHEFLRWKAREAAKRMLSNYPNQ